MVSCDEMRDHLFQMLAPKYFRKWKQRHQVYFKCAAAQCSVPSCRLALHEHKAHQSRPNKQNYLNLDTLLQSAGKAGKETTCIFALCRSIMSCSMHASVVAGQSLRMHVVPYGPVLCVDRFRADGRAVLTHPAPFTHCTQRLEASGAWMFPAADSAEWLCARPAT